MVRGVSYGGTVFAVTDFTANHNRNLITEQGMGLGGEPVIYDGATLITGSIGAVYRDSFATYAQAVLDLLSGASSTISTNILISSDETSGVSFPSSFINSFELNLQSKDMARCTMGFVAKGPGSAGSVGTAASYTDAVPIGWASTLSINSVVIKTTGITLRLKVPIDQDNYVIGSKYLDSIIQSGNGTLSGSLTLAPSEWAILQSAMGSCGNLSGNIVITLNGQSASDCSTSLVRTITITDAVASDSSFSGQNRNKFTKTLNWKAPVGTSTNHNLFS